MTISASSSAMVFAAVAWSTSVLFERLLLVGVQVVVVLGDVVHGFGEELLAAVAELLCPERVREPLLAALERLVDGLGAGGEAALQAW